MVLVGVAGYGFTNGDPYKLVTTWDFDKNGCGYSAATKDYPFLYFPKIDVSAASDAANSASQGKFSTQALTETLQYSTCVKTCPTRTSVVDCLPPSFMVKEPNYFANCTWYMGTTSVSSTAMRYETAPILGKFCMPSDKELANEALSQFNKLFQSVFGAADLGSYIADIANT